MTHVTACGRAANIDVQEKVVSIFKGENKAPDFLALYPLGKLPFLTARLCCMRFSQTFC